MSTPTFAIRADKPVEKAFGKGSVAVFCPEVCGILTPTNVNGFGIEHPVIRLQMSDNWKHQGVSIHSRAEQDEALRGMQDEILSDCELTMSQHHRGHPAESWERAAAFLAALADAAANRARDLRTEASS